MPRIANATFQLTCNHAPSSTSGLLLLAARALVSPLQVLGVDLWVDPGSAWLASFPVASHAAGGAYVPLAVPGVRSLVGLRLNAQFVWVGPGAPPPCPPSGWSASNALEVTIQM